MFHVLFFTFCQYYGRSTHEHVRIPNPWHRVTEAVLDRNLAAMVLSSVNKATLKLITKLPVKNHFRKRRTFNLFHILNLSIITDHVRTTAVSYAWQLPYSKMHWNWSGRRVLPLYIKGSSGKENITGWTSQDGLVSAPSPGQGW